MDKSLRFGMMLFLASAVLISSGCEPLRKKFMRKKKADVVQDKGAIYDPIEYPAVVKTSAENYSQHYGLWKVWLGDLTLNMEGNANDKKIQYTLTQMQEQLAAMRNLLNPDFQTKVDGCLSEVAELSAEFAKPLALRNKAFLTSSIRSLDRRVKNDLALNKVRDHLVSQ
jgi:hypothetical protein